MAAAQTPPGNDNRPATIDDVVRAIDTFKESAKTTGEAKPESPQGQDPAPTNGPAD